MYAHEIIVHKTCKTNTCISEHSRYLVYKIYKNMHESLCILPIDYSRDLVYNINRTKESEVKKMPLFPNECYPDNTDAKELTEYAAQLLDEINERK